MAVIEVAPAPCACYNPRMDEGWTQQVDALCRRHCALALYRLPGGQECVQFCMQADGGLSPWQAGESGFLLAPFDGEPYFIRRELRVPPESSGYPVLPPHQPDTPASTPQDYARLFALYRAQMPVPLHKIVLARTEDVSRGEDFSPARAFLAACERSPMNFNALLHSAEHGTWLCSTPELLLRGNADSWETMALAGTRPATADSNAPWDSKNQREQQLVADYIRDCLKPRWEQGDVQRPRTLRAGAVEHICTRFRFRMAPERLGELLRTLPPTPAVCGHPVEAARAWLRQQPDIDRGLYAGYLGPQGAEGVQLFVTLRCMRIYAACCRLYAGGGLMPDSDPTAEWQETQAKMQAMRQLLTLPQ